MGELKSGKLLGLRKQIREIDDQIFKLVGQRLKLAHEVGQVKLEENMPIKDYPAEKRIMEKNIALAQDHGIFGDMAVDLTKLLIKYAVLTQDEYHAKMRRTPTSGQENVLIVGGLGQMGQWHAQFFQSFGHQVSIYDQGESSSAAFQNMQPDFEKGVKEASVVFLTTPIEVSKDILTQLLNIETDALIVDICSIKSPIYEVSDKLLQQGKKMASVHPLFGPKVEWLAGRNILVCEMEGVDHHKKAQSLFTDTTAQLIPVPFKQHDELMGYILGLSHMTNLIFARTLVKSGYSFSDLEKIGSTTFDSQVGVSQAVSGENQSLYYEIQSTNSATPKVMSHLKEVLEEFSKAVDDTVSDSFVELMESCRKFYQKS